MRVIDLRTARAVTARVCPLPLSPGSDPALVGTAVGYVLTATLAPEALRESVAVAGAGQLDGMVRGGELPSVVVRRAIERVGALHASKADTASGPAWVELCQLCLLLARCEQWFRAGLAVSDFVRPLLEWAGGELSQLTEALAGPSTLTDLDALGKVALEDLGQLFTEGPLHIGPTFAQSGPLGGADADVIAGGMLLDLKATTQPGVVGRKELWQLLGYLLADTDDEYSIQRVGFAALRWRNTASWGTADYLRALGGGGRSLTDWRQDFAELLAALAASNRCQRSRSLTAPTALC
jgi:hypothetical protein